MFSINAQHTRILLHQRQSQTWMPLGTCLPMVPRLGLRTPTQERKKRSLCCEWCQEKRKHCITCQSWGAPYPPRQTWYGARLSLKWNGWKAVFQNKGPVSLRPVLLPLKPKAEGKHALKTPFLQIHQVCLWSSASPWIPVTENSVLFSDTNCTCRLETLPWPAHPLSVSLICEVCPCGSLPHTVTRPRIFAPSSDNHPPVTPHGILSKFSSSCFLDFTIKHLEAVVSASNPPPHPHSLLDHRISIPHHCT